ETLGADMSAAFAAATDATAPASQACGSSTCGARRYPSCSPSAARPKHALGRRDPSTTHVDVRGLPAAPLAPRPEQVVPQACCPGVGHPSRLLLLCSASVPSDHFRTGTKNTVNGIRSLGADNTGEPGTSAPHSAPATGGPQNITCGYQCPPAAPI